MNHTLKASLAGLILVGAGSGLAGWKAMGSGRVLEQGSTHEIATTAGHEAEVRSRGYTVDPVHTNVLFKIRHGSVSNFYGRFNTVSGAVNFDKLHVARSSMEITVQTSSIDTNSRVRDGDIKGASFLNARQFGEITFSSTGIEEIGDGVYTITGDLTFSGKTMPISAEMIDVRTGKFRDNNVLGFEARFSIKRSDFGLTKYLDTKDPEKGPLGDVVELIVAVEAFEDKE